MPVEPPRQMLPPLNALRAFEAAARLGSFTRAAQEIGVTSGAVAQQIRHLESHLGFPLFRRLSQGVSLTDAGRQAQPRLSAAFEALALAVRELRRSHAARPLSVAVLPCIAQLWLSPRLPALQRAFPALQLAITAMERPPVEHDGAFDLALFYRPADESADCAFAFPEDRLMPVCAPGLVERDVQDIRTALRGRTLLHDAVWRADWARWLRHAGITGIEAGHGPSFSLYALALDAALSGGGLLIGRASLVARPLEEGRLEAPFDPTMPSGDRLVVMAPETQAPHPLQHAVIDWLSRNG